MPDKDNLSAVGAALGAQQPCGALGSPEYIDEATLQCFGGTETRKTQTLSADAPVFFPQGSQVHTMFEQMSLYPYPGMNPHMSQFYGPPGLHPQLPQQGKNVNTQSHQQGKNVNTLSHQQWKNVNTQSQQQGKNVNTQPQHQGKNVKRQDKNKRNAVRLQLQTQASNSAMSPLMAPPPGDQRKLPTPQQRGPPKNSPRPPPGLTLQTLLLAPHFEEDPNSINEEADNTLASDFPEFNRFLPYTSAQFLGFRMPFGGAGIMPPPPICTPQGTLGYDQQCQLR